MLDLSYTEALERAPEPHIVLLGPVACQGCGAAVEWAGIAWLAVGTLEAHRCAPFLAGQRWRDQAHPLEPCAHGFMGPHSAAGLLPTAQDDHCSGPGSWYPIAPRSAAVLFEDHGYPLIATGGRGTPVGPVTDLPALPWQLVLAVLAVVALALVAARWPL
jgi:hypothetical protein